MADSELRYDKMVEEALRSVVRDALRVAAEHGLPGEHHFYVTFLTAFPGVKIPDHVRARHTDEMTIVLQHQYWGLEVEEDYFEVTLSFSGISERLCIPFAAVTGFADPSAKFGLQFQPVADDDDEFDDAPVDLPLPAAKPESEEGETGKVVALDAFRKK